MDMRTAASVVAVLLVFGAAAAVWANHCHEGGGSAGCTMDGCPGSGLTMKQVTGTVTQVAKKHNLVKVKAGEQVLELRVHPECPNKDKLTKQVAGLKVGQTLKATYYAKDAKTYLCQVGETETCH